jgi:hypothetical protein
MRPQIHERALFSLFAAARHRKRIEEANGWIKTVGGMQRAPFRGLPRMGWMFAFKASAYNLVHYLDCSRRDESVQAMLKPPPSIVGGTKTTSNQPQDMKIPSEKVWTGLTRQRRMRTKPHVDAESQIWRKRHQGPFGGAGLRSSPAAAKRGVDDAGLEVGHAPPDHRTCRSQPVASYNVR